MSEDECACSRAFQQMHPKHRDGLWNARRTASTMTSDLDVITAKAHKKDQRVSLNDPQVVKSASRISRKTGPALKITNEPR